MTILQVHYSSGRDVASDESIETEAFSLIVMEDVSDRFQQSCSMDRSRAMALMEALATLHSHYWGKGTVDSKVNFAKPARDLDEALEKLGAQRYLPTGYGDDQDADQYHTGPGLDI